MNIIFQQIKSKDKSQVLLLFKNAAERIHKMNINHWQYWLNPPVEKVKWVEEGIQNNEFFFIQTLEGEHLGMVRIMDEDLLYWGKQNEKATYIHSLVVTDKYNGKGIGTKIILQIEANAKEVDCKYLRLDADAKNPRLCRYYEKLGFEKVGTKKLPLSTYNLYQKELK